MPVSVTMPRLGESVTEGTVTRWLKQEGDQVEADEPLLEVSTDKVDTEIPSPAAGVLTRIVVRRGRDRRGRRRARRHRRRRARRRCGRRRRRAGRGAGRRAEPRRRGGRAAEAAAAEPPRPPAAEAGRREAAAAPPPAARRTSLKMPALGESVTEGTVTRWLKQVGDAVEADEPLLEVSTDKVDTEIPSPVAGTLLEIKVDEDETVEVGAELAVIGAAGAAPAPAGAARTGRRRPAAAAAQPAPAAGAGAAPSPRPSRPRAAAGRRAGAGSRSGARAAGPGQARPPPHRPPPAGTSADGKVEGDDAGYVTPLVRKLATEHGVDLSPLSGTGVGGRIRKQDVLDAAAKAKQAAAARRAAPPPRPRRPPRPRPRRRRRRARCAARPQKLTRMRALIARRMVESLQVSAQLTTVVEVDVTKIAEAAGAGPSSSSSTRTA